MTVADLLCALAKEVQAGHSEWEVDVSILKKNPHKDESLRHFGSSMGIHRNREYKKFFVLGSERPLLKGEL